MVDLRTPKGTVDYDPSDTSLLSHILTTTTSIYKNHGATSLDTPTFELSHILKNKYSDDSKLIFDLKDQGGDICSLRYDLTVSFARYLAQKRVEKMKRYQYGKVFRRDQPVISKGRYREFMQCDFDIAGVYEKMTVDAEVVKIAVECMETLVPGEGYRVCVNHRQVHAAVFILANIPKEVHGSICSTIDKKNKISDREMEIEFLEKGLSREQIGVVNGYIGKSGIGEDFLNELVGDGIYKIDEGREAVDDLFLLYNYCKCFGCEDNIVFDLSLARGTDYYTGIIFECVYDNFDVGAVIGGGRYDNLVRDFVKEKSKCNERSKLNDNIDKDKSKDNIDKDKCNDNIDKDKSKDNIDNDNLDNDCIKDNMDKDYINYKSNDNIDKNKSKDNIDKDKCNDNIDKDKSKDNIDNDNLDNDCIKDNMDKDYINYKSNDNIDKNKSKDNIDKDKCNDNIDKDYNKDNLNKDYIKDKCNYNIDKDKCNDNIDNDNLDNDCIKDNLDKDCFKDNIEKDCFKEELNERLDKKNTKKISKSKLKKIEKKLSKENKENIFEVPCVGFSVGIARIFSILKDRIDLKSNPTNIFVGSSGGHFLEERMKVLNELWKEKISAETFYNKMNFRKQASYCIKNKIPFIVILGEEELKNDFVQITTGNKEGIKMKIERKNMIEKIKIMISEIQK